MSASVELGLKCDVGAIFYLFISVFFPLLVTSFTSLACTGMYVPILFLEIEPQLSGDATKARNRKAVPALPCHIYIQQHAHKDFFS